MDTDDCAVTKNFSEGTCFSLNDLIALSVAYSKEFPDNKIKLSAKLDTLNPQKYKLYLVKELEKRLSTICDNQQCWLKQKFIKHMDKARQYELKKLTFKPDGPKGYDEWLSNFDIEATMKQYEKKYPDFKFLGAVPLDFDEFTEFGTKHLNLNDLFKSGIKKYGLVVNLDKSHQSGSHWVSVYADLSKGQIYYYDSYGSRPEQDTRKFLRKLQKICDKHNIQTEVSHNKFRHQYGDGACGLYSMAFILNLLKGTQFDEYVKQNITDKEMNDCREVYFL